MKPLGWVAAILIGLVCLKLYVAAERKDAERVALLAQKDSIIAVHADRLREESTAHFREVARLDSLIANRERREAQAKRRTDSLLSAAGNIANDIIVAAPEVRPLVDSLTDYYGHVIALKDSVISDLWDVIRQQDVALASADSLILSYQRQLDLAIAQGAAWKARSQPGVFEQAKRALPWMAATYLAAKVL